MHFAMSQSPHIKCAAVFFYNIILDIILCERLSALRHQPRELYDKVAVCEGCHHGTVIPCHRTLRHPKRSETDVSQKLTPLSSDGTQKTTW